ncbi:winged helix-turn-helix domain-containing protein [Cytobacillus sp.]|uniref:winged helix-turn-helix domain-containing protein n=1 Tax=Cytobacillus sp. TaxID=2675269 RepID=UPI0028BDB5E7|nr:winged helix-turn-helix domain-containing protein [Cytobacillus sp.]
METKYQEIMKEILNRISDGRFNPGDKLPSIRSLSDEFDCSLNTIVKAYSEMEKEHKIYSVPKSGYYLLGSRQTESRSSEEIIDFSSAGPDRWNMPYRDYQHC